MIVEGVNFNEKLVRQMSRADFIRRHLPCCFTDRDVKDRRKMLAEIYDRICQNNPQEEE